jgi:hypothetical protein
MKHIKGHHCFKIQCDESGKAVIYTKQWSTDKDWKIAVSRDDNEPYFLSSHPSCDNVKLAGTQYQKMMGKKNGKPCIVVIKIFYSRHGFP